MNSINQFTTICLEVQENNNAKFIDNHYTQIACTFEGSDQHHYTKRNIIVAD